MGDDPSVASTDYSNPWGKDGTNQEPGNRKRFFLIARRLEIVPASVVIHASEIAWEQAQASVMQPVNLVERRRRRGRRGNKMLD